MPIVIAAETPRALELPLADGPDAPAVLLRHPTLEDRLFADAMKSEPDWLRFYEWLLAHLVGWRGFVDESGAELPFTPENVARALGQRGEVYARMRDGVWGMYSD